MNYKNKLKNAFVKTLRMLFKGITKLHHIPLGSVQAVSCIAGIITEDFDEVEKIFHKNPAKWPRGARLAVIDAISLNVDKFFDEKQEKWLDLWSKGIESGLCFDEGDHTSITKFMRQLFIQKDHGIAEKWAEHQKIKTEHIHEIASLFLLHISNFSDKFGDGAWAIFQAKYLDDFDPDYIFKKTSGDDFKSREEGVKFISNVFIYGPESLCLKMIDKINFLEDNELGSLLLRYGEITPVMFERMEKKANASGHIELIEKILSNYELAVSDEKYLSKKERIQDKIKHLVDENPKIGKNILDYWVLSEAKTDKNIIKDKIIESKKELKNDFVRPRKKHKI